MAVAEAVSTYDEFVYGVVILLFDLSSGVQQVVSQRVEFGEVNPQVGDFQLI